jgi:TonB family protein
MNKRLQKKCFIASAGIHLLLVVVVLIGPAFLPSKEKVTDMVILSVIPPKLIDAQFSNAGGAPAPKQTPAARPPEPVTPPVKPPSEIKRHELAPVKEAEPEKSEPESLELRNRNKHKVVISTTPVVRKKSTTKPKPDTSEGDNQAKQVADARRRAADMIGKTARSLREGTAPSTTIELNEGSGSGEAYANYDQVVQSIYFHAWLVPDDTKSDTAITKVSVTISRNGQVASFRVLRPSGDSIVDRSVDRTLERVKFIAPFPEGSKDKERTYTINFNLSAKRLLAGQ